MRRLVLVLAIAGCSSESDGQGQGTTIIDPDVIVASITHERVGLDVYNTNDFLMTGNCRSLRGAIPESEMASLKSYMADELIQTLGMECGDGAYRIKIGLGAQSRCWTKDQKGPAIEGLAAFFDSKAAKLAETPEGKCDGTAQNVGESKWAKGKDAAGSGG